MLKFIIYENDEKYVEGYTNAINKVMMGYNFDYRILKFSKNTSKLKEEIKNTEDEKIYILDIQMPEVTGLELASKIRENDWNSIILFVTNYSQHKNDIFYSRLMAIDYIEKKTDYKDRLSETLDIAIKALGKQNVLVFTFNHIVHRIPISEIMYIEKAAVGKKSYIVTLEGEEYEIAGSITALQERLGNKFFRSHKSCLVNLDNIKNINYSENTITFVNDDEIDLLSVRCKKEIKKVCNK